MLKKKAPINFFDGASGSRGGFSGDGCGGNRFSICCDAVAGLAQALSDEADELSCIANEIRQSELDIPLVISFIDAAVCRSLVRKTEKSMRQVRTLSSALEQTVGRYREAENTIIANI